MIAGQLAENRRERVARLGGIGEGTGVRESNPNPRKNEAMSKPLSWTMEENGLPDWAVQAVKELEAQADPNEQGWRDLIASGGLPEARSAHADGRREGLEEAFTEGYRWCLSECDRDWSDGFKEDCATAWQVSDTRLRVLAAQDGSDEG